SRPKPTPPTASPSTKTVVSMSAGAETGESTARDRKAAEPRFSRKFHCTRESFLTAKPSKRSPPMALFLTNKEPLFTSPTPRAALSGESLSVLTAKRDNQRYCPKECYSKAQTD